MTARSRQTFQQIVTLPDRGIPLAEAALLFACEEYPQLALPPYLEQLDSLASRVREVIGPAAAPENTIAGLNRVLFTEYGLLGNTTAYYDPRNSFLNDVLERRRGIPITLSAIYIAVAERVGFSLDGMGLPGHFVVRHRWDGGEIFVDPFNEGALLSDADLTRLAGQMASPGREVGRWLQRTSNRQMLTRMLNNLKTIYIRSGAFDKALSMVDLMLITAPLSPDLYRQRGLLRLRTHQFEGAARDLRFFLDSRPEPEESKRLKQYTRQVARIRAMLN